MKKTEKNQKWVFNKDIDGEQAAEGVVRKILAYCDSMMCVENHFEKGAVGNMHSHPHTQITYVARLSINIDERPVKLSGCWFPDSRGKVKQLTTNITLVVFFIV